MNTCGICGLLVALTASTYAQSQPICQTPPCLCGSVVDTYQTVKAYYNGGGTGNPSAQPCQLPPKRLPEQTVDPKTSLSAQDGEEYECVELIRRFYRIAKYTPTANWSGDAGTFYSSLPTFGFTPFKNNGGSTSPPRPDDVIGFYATSFNPKGHVAIVKSVDLSACGGNSAQGQFTVELIEQNTNTENSVTGKRHELLGQCQQQTGGAYTYTITPRCAQTCSPIQGWLRLPTRFAFTHDTGIPRADHSATRLENGQVLIVGGVSNPPLAATATAQLYNPTTAMFSVTGSLNTARYSHTATLLQNGLVLIAGGFANGVPLSSAELYNPTSGLFTASKGQMQSPSEQGQTATLLQSGEVLITGGQSGRAQLYDPVMDTFTVTGSMQTGRFWYSGTLLPNGKVLIAGGFSISGSVASAEIYDPDTGKFGAAGNMTTARELHTATLLPNGKVLLAGGTLTVGGYNYYLQSAELYDPNIGTFTPTQNPVTARASHVASVLQDGTVLLASGYTFCGTNGSGCGVVTPTAEIFNPISNGFTSTANISIARYRTTATLLPTGAVLIPGGSDAQNLLNSAELYIP